MTSDVQVANNAQLNICKGKSWSVTMHCPAIKLTYTILKTHGRNQDSSNAVGIRYQLPGL